MEGDPVPVTVSVGDAWSIDLASANWVAPAGVGSIIGGALEEQPIIFVTAVSDTSLDMGASFAADAECVAFPSADFSTNPEFQIGPQDVNFEVSGYSIPITDLEIAGHFAEDAGSINDLSLAGQIDVRSIADLIGSLLGVTDPDEICGLLVSFGATCTGCTDGTTYCLDVDVQDIPNESSDAPICP
jgi:hypothetical protein